MAQRLAHAQAPDSHRGHSKSRKQCPVELHYTGKSVTVVCEGWRDSLRKADRNPRGVLRISSNGDYHKIWGYDFGIFLVGKFGKYFLEEWLDLRRDFGGIQN